MGPRPQWVNLPLNKILSAILVFYYHSETWKNGRHFADDILKCDFWKDNFGILIQIPWSLLPGVQLTEWQHKFK